MLRLVVLVLLVLPNFAMAETGFTETNGPHCKDYSKPEFGNWICPGPGGYAVQFSDEGNLASLAIAPAGAIRKMVPSAQWLGANKVFGDKVAWVIRNGVPKAAVIRIWRRNSVEDSTEIQELSVFAINQDKACPFAAVDIHRPGANEAAANQAEQAADWRCTEK